MRLAACAIAIALAQLAFATEFQAVPDEKSGVSFKATTTFHEFIGRSTQVSAHFRLTDGQLHDAEVSVPVSSIRTGNSGRDRDMVSADYLDQAVHPNIVFKASQFVGPTVQEGSDGSGQLQGTLTVRGTERPVSIPVQYQWTGDRLVVHGELPIDIRDYGMKPPTVMVVQRMDAEVLMRFRLTFAPE